ncbi:MsnO8 family LLM class oxidoreductase [Sphingobacterium lactis]|uniref:Luciferase family oxidoreductase, group 1 n=1 Tax=Sphingobacterium lactis TaxID=797291 RepID=A0A1H6BVV5_9SPHI|nr:MsnO8 family LLM class oxidoreductase [Sphingobacterium lactis]SEG64803.1 luciferase family oxidoreductase, group 1 [Sphingobacterium lactis]
MKNNIVLSVLDIGPIRENQTSSQAFSSMTDLAQHAEELGYNRFWVAEHHNASACVAGSTSVIAGAIAGKIKAMNTGGYVLLPHYTPFLVAEQSATLEAFYPGRIDLCIGGATGTDSLTTALIRGGRMNANQDYAEMIQQTLLLLQEGGADFYAENKKYHFSVMNGANSKPSVWLMGASEQEAIIAAELGIGFALPFHVTADYRGAEVIQVYRDNFKASTFFQEPKASATAIAVVGESQQEAERLAIAHLQTLGAFRSGELKGLQPLSENISAEMFSSKYRAMTEHMRLTWAIGNAEKVVQKLNEIIDVLKPDELMISPMNPSSKFDDPNLSQARVGALEAIAKGFGMV